MDLKDLEFKPEDFTGPFKDGSTGQVLIRSGMEPEPLFTAEMCAENANRVLRRKLESLALGSATTDLTKPQAADTDPQLD